MEVHEVSAFPLSKYEPEVLLLINKTELGMEHRDETTYTFSSALIFSPFAFDNYDS